MIVRKRQLAAKIEAVEGAAETLSSADGGILVNFTPKANFDPQMYQRDPVRSSLTKLGKLTGKRAAGLNFAIELRGSGSILVQPEWARLIKACGFQMAAVKKVHVSGIANGYFQHCETITGATSGATGRVICNTFPGTDLLYFQPISGEFQEDEQFAGAKSGATGVIEALPLDAGFEVRPSSSDVPSLTMGLYEDGVRKMLKGCRGSVKFGFKIGEPVLMEFNFMGVESGVSDVPLLTGLNFNTTIPPVLLNANLTCGDASLNIGEMEIDTANTLVSKDKINDPKGILSYLITARDMKGSFNPEMVSVGTHDFFGKWFNNAGVDLNLEYGSEAGNRFRFYAPKMVYTKVDDTERDGIQLASTSFDLTGSMDPGDDELSLLLL